MESLDAARPPRPPPPRWGKFFPWALGGSLLAAAGLAVAGGVLYASRQGAVGRLEVSSVPPICEVRLDGRFVGVTPLVLEDVAGGEHMVELRREGYRPEAVEVEVSGWGQRPLHVRMQPADRGGLKVVSDPPGATVILDGESRGVTPLELEGLRPGAHRLVLRRARCETVSRAVQVPAGAAAEVAVELVDSFRKFLQDSVTADPKDMLPRAELFHYLMTRRDWPAAAGTFLETLVALAEGQVTEIGKGGLWHWLAKDAAFLADGGETAFQEAFATHFAALAGEDPEVAAKVLTFMGSRARNPGRWAKRTDLLRRWCTAAALKAAGSRPVLESALDQAAWNRSSTEIEKLLSAAADAGDAEHVGYAAIRVVNAVKRSAAGDAFRQRSLKAAAAAVEEALSGKIEDALLAARLRRLMGRIRLAQGREEDALAEHEKAIAALRTIGDGGAEEAGRLALWRLERAELLIKLERGAEARKILAELAKGAPDDSVREKAGRLLAELGVEPPE